ncbi:MAG TPA: FG-GAP-like repeat-containing protein, partial [Thermoanaerobaculia bacterium]
MVLQQAGDGSRNGPRTAALILGLFAVTAPLGPSTKLAPTLRLTSSTQRIGASATFTGTTINTSSNPIGVAAGDLDCDEKPELVVGFGSGGSISVLPNTSNGGVISFGTAQSFTTQLAPNDVAIGDLDGDGRADLATANDQGSSVSILRNTTSGSLSFTSTTLPTNSSAMRFIEMGDLDGDGRLDLVATQFAVSSLNIFRNTSSVGSISFNSQTLSINKSDAHVALGDLDGDGKLDLILTHGSSNQFEVRRNTSTVGSITFAAEALFPTAGQPAGVVVADIDADSKSDVIVASEGPENVSVFRNTTTGGTISFAARVDFTTPADPTDVRVADFDGDGRPDLAVISSSTLSTLRNTSSAGTISFATREDSSIGGKSADVTVADFDRDGKSDIGVTNNGGNTAVIFRNTTVTTATADDYYVATTGSNTTGTGTEASPWKTITYALSQITGTGKTLHVAAGTYDTTLGETFPINIKNGVSLAGAGIDASILDAKGTGTVLRAASITDGHTRVEGFTIKGSGGAAGVGVSISGGSILRIANNKITANFNGSSFGTGGGIYVDASSPRITGNTI